MQHPSSKEAVPPLPPSIVPSPAETTCNGPGYVQRNYHIADGNLYSVLTPSPAVDKGNRAPRARGRRRARWKLKFHHQALPPEYREHYEASTEAAASSAEALPAAAVTPSTAGAPNKKQEEAAFSSVSPAKTHNTTPSPKTYKSPSHSSSSRSSVIMASPPMPPPLQPIDRASDLPYMGEITLDSKPRRGRKPKKADICHLIYKNYGTVFPSPKNSSTDEAPPITAAPKPKSSRTKDGDGDKKCTQSRNPATWTKGVSSLLEKRLTGELSSSKSSEINAALSRVVEKRRNILLQESACDRLPKVPNNHLPSDYKSLENKHKDVSSFNACAGNRVVGRAEDPRFSEGLMRDPNLAQACVKRLLAYAAGLGEQNEPLNLCVRDNVKPEPTSCSDSETEDHTKAQPSDLLPAENSQPEGYVFWPNAGVLVHPQLLYNPPSPTPTIPTLVTSPKLVKKKRKRSAIFIPPAESPTEVSICKFKFTGGAKPTLEEKKMLSVDAGGNFRFYSGTDKGMRSFLPHLQHSTILGNSSTPSKKMHLPSPPEQIPLDAPSTSMSLPLDHLPPHLSPPSPPDRPPSLANSKRKRRSRKSEVREKLEQTFKEKGFLIQTQQLESAEGATYCKFRQLRKFTRYLFRSWRDYLPHSVQDLSTSQQEQGAASSTCSEIPPNSPS